MARSAIHALVIWGVAALVSVAVVTAASGRSPVGEARAIERSAPLEVDGRVLVVGLAGLALVVEAALVLPSVALRARRERARRTPLARLAADVGLGPPAVMGVRVGIEPDRRSVPARSAVLAVAIGVASVVGVLVYTASAQHLRETPAERGVVWDEFVYVAERSDSIELVEELREWPEVEAIGPAGYFTLGIELGPDAVQARVMAFGSAPGDIEPRVITGRAPEGRGDIVLNPKLADALDVSVGDTIEVAASTAGMPPEEVEALGELPRETFEVVGTAAVPLGDGAFAVGSAMTIDGYISLLPGPFREEAEAGGADFLMIRRTDGVSTDELVARLAEIDVDHEPADPVVAEELIDNILSVDQTGTESVPDLLGWLMLVTGAGVLTFGLVVTLSRSRHELAIVRAVGFDRRLVRRTSRWAGFAQAAAALVVGVPLGIVAGRYAWHLYARSLGVAEVEHVPAVELAALVAGTIAFSVGVASLAGRWVSRRSPGAVLRALD
jgi:ABC-type lipoprotein release transport system permease subunit